MNAKELTKILEEHSSWLKTLNKGKRANLQDAYLRGADLQDADLQDANLQDAYLPNFQICPETGSFDAWKAGRNKCIIKLRIPASAKRTSSLVGRKCRASKAKVLEIKDRYGNKIDSCLCWNNNYDFIYEVGKTAIPNSYNDDIRFECSNGIHFFIIRKEAEEW